MHRLAIPVLAIALAGGCATLEERIDSTEQTADQALRAAQAAQQTADEALRAAQMGSDNQRAIQLAEEALRAARDAVERVNRLAETCCGQK